MSLVDDIRNGLRVSDTQFEKLFHQGVRDIARTHWTPFDVAAAAVTLLIEGQEPGARFKVLDVGSNVGKFCLIGALRSNAHFVGVEIRRDFVDLARKTAREHHIERVRFVWSDMKDIDWSEFGGIYLFNPFYENLEESVQIDDQVTLNPKLHDTYVRETQFKLSACMPGTRVVTYYGFGGEMPPEYVSKPHEFHDQPNLELWVKT